MRISEAIPMVLLEQTVFDIHTAKEAVAHVLDTLITQEEYDAGKWVPGVAVLDGPDPDHPEFDEGYYAYKEVLEWYRFPIDLKTYLFNRMYDDLGGPDDPDDPFDGGQMEAMQVGIEAGLRAASIIGSGVVVSRLGEVAMVDVTFDAEVPAADWALALDDTDPADAYDALAPEEK